MSTRRGDAISGFHDVGVIGAPIMNVSKRTRHLTQENTVSSCGIFDTGSLHFIFVLDQPVHPKCPENPDQFLKTSDSLCTLDPFYGLIRIH